MNAVVQLEISSMKNMRILGKNTKWCYIIEFNHIQSCWSEVSPWPRALGARKCCWFLDPTVGCTYARSNRKRPADKDVFLLNVEDFHFKVELWLNYWRSSIVKNVQAMILSTFILQESACRKWAQPRSAYARSRAEPFRLEAMSVDNVARVFALADKYSCNRHWINCDIPWRIRLVLL